MKAAAEAVEDLMPECCIIPLRSCLLYTSYTVTEDAVEGYTTELDGNNFINTHVPETTEISGTKTWNDAEDQDGKRPESITVRLLANGIEKDSQIVKADEAGSWTYKFTDLPKYEAREEIVYTVTEDAVPDTQRKSAATISPTATHLARPA